VRSEGGPAGSAGVSRHSYRLALGIAVVASLLLVWLSLGVGIIGQDGDPANRMYFGVLAVGLAGALWSRGGALGMVRVMGAMAIAQAVVAALALGFGLGRPYSGPLELVLLNGFFVAAFAAAAALFRRAAR
jgi:hypothetical protein